MKETNKEVNDLKKRLNKTKFKPIESPLGKFWKDKNGNKLTYNQFMSKWKEGLKGVTPFQQTRMQLNSTYIMLIGILCGFVITLFNLKNLWWLSIILGAAFFNTSISALGLWQKKIALHNIKEIDLDEIMNKLEGGK